MGASGQELISPETFFPRRNSQLKPILFWRESARILAIVLTERVIGPIEIDEHLSSWHRLDIQITSPEVCLCLRRFVLERKKKLSTAQGAIDLKGIIPSSPFESEAALLHVFSSTILIRRQGHIEGFGPQGVFFNRSHDGVAEVNGIINEPLKPPSILFGQWRMGIFSEEPVSTFPEGLQFFHSVLHGIAFNTGVCNASSGPSPEKRKKEPWQEN